MDDVFVLYDRATNSVWYPDEAALQAVGGAHKGKSIPFLDEPEPVKLADWLRELPDSTVLLPTEEDVREWNRPFLGVRLEEQDGAVVIASVVEDSPAAEAEFREGDLLLSLEDRAVEARGDLGEILLDFERGQTVEIVVERDGKKLTLRPTLGTRPEE